MNKIITLFFLLGMINLQAQTFTNYTTAEGLINNSTNCLAIDADDNLWIGTQEGISYFDGTNWTNYDVNSHPGLIHNTITAIAVDSDNNVWLGTDFGVSKFDGTVWTNYTEDDGLADNRVKYINQDANGNIWFANNDGISIFDGTNWTSYTMADGLPFGGTNYVIFDDAGNAWLGTPLGGVLIFDGTDFTGITENEGLLNDKVTTIAIDADNNKWIGTSDGISVFDENNEFVTHHEIIFILPPPDELNPIEDIKIGLNGRVWVGVYVDYLVTEGGISLYANDTWEDFDVNDGLAGPVVRRLAIDSQNNVWVATSTGISKIGNFPSSTFDLAIDNQVLAYPNPASAVLNLKVPNDLVGSSYQVFNSLGMNLQEGIVTNEEMTLDLTNLANGIYFLSVDGVYTRKVLVNRR